MADENNKISNQNDAKVKKIIDDLTLFDDDLMTLVFNKNIPATELILRIILKRNIRVISVDAQEEMRSPIVGGRDITLDIHAIDEDGEEINVEVQGSSEGAHVRRARFHSAVMDSRMLKENDPFKILKDSYVIFIYKHDKFGKGLPIYRAERVISEIEEPLNDGSHIVYVNGNYKGNDEIGKLMADFRSTSSDGMNYKELADGLHHFKETEEGRDVMCESVKKYAEEYAKEYAEEYAKEYAEEYAKEYAEEYATDTKIEMVKNLMSNMKWTLEQTLNNMGVSDNERSIITKQLQK
ncbi:PD-(D/E)XK nuclease family transposase [Butyrivibrio hungatei]|uniref:PD-(D/E)XK nuclease family transposase n=1 Tax=Butyrivibrio hungatei TaxID=185008 RepID=UPI000412789F|nr:PD-(D/E)XK nuclease family transposase [Butyrivibrio hungatei]